MTEARGSFSPGPVVRRVIVLAAIATLLATGCAADATSGTIVASASTRQVGVHPESLPPATSPGSIGGPSSLPTGDVTSPGATFPSDPSGPATTPTPTPGGTIPPTLARIPAGSVPILYYHRIEAPPVEYAGWSADQRRRFITYDVIPAAFAAQLDWLRDHGYTTILPRDLASHWDHGTALPTRSVIITFDDGSPDWVTTVLPMLQARGMVAEFYLTLDAIAEGDLTWGDVRRLAAAGNGIGAHDVHHVQLTALGHGRAGASPQEMWAEVNGARTIIGQHIGVLPDSMAYVGGGFDATLERLVQQAGYTSARSIRRGIVQDPARRFELRVVRIGPHDDVLDLIRGDLVPDLPTFTARMQGVSDTVSSPTAN